ncbi:hypothetical protein EWB00_003160 [Schistosoma japonicum]|uniref:Axin beta-catenin binding domain-containing protein n=1 Tax=Schistosoma japonicum TaxID=6182 RepID=A0A4Z2D9F9_SCHJA|nr:hypothetical protein EWB00_003160 [Schistosoma japonicum]
MNECSMDKISKEDNSSNNNLIITTNKFSSEDLLPIFDHSKHLKQDINEQTMNTTNQSYLVSLSNYNTTNTNISERQIDTDRQNNQNISKLEDILSDISLSTFFEPLKTVKQETTEIKSSRLENTVLKTDGNSTFNSKLHPIFGEKSWAQSLFKECVNFYDEYKENPERILDDHFDRIWKTREALMLLEDQVDLQNAFRRHSKKPSKARKKYQANNDNTYHSLKDFKKNVEVNSKDEQTYWNYNISQYINNNELNDHGSNTSQLLSNEYLNQFNQSQLTKYTYYTQSQLKSYRCNNCNKYYFDYDNSFNKVDNGDFITHSSEVITDDLDFNSFAYKRRNNSQNAMITRSRRRSYFMCSEESKYVSSRKYHSNNYLLRNSISLPNLTTNKQDLQLNNFITCVVYVSEDSLPHIIQCKNNQWTLKLFKRKLFNSCIQLIQNYNMKFTMNSRI